MLDFIKERESVWDRLLHTDKPIVLYGMGNGADKILDWCDESGVKVSGIFASDEFARYQEFRGYTVCRYSDITEKFGSDILIVIAFASERAEVLAKFRELSEKHETLAPHLPLFADEEETVSRAWLEKYAGSLEYVYSRLADERSRKVFADILNYKLSGKIDYLFDCTTQRRDDLQELFAFGSEETYLDLGAYTGDTVEEFLQLTAGKYRRIIALEPDRRNFAKLARYAAAISGEIMALQKGIWQEAGERGFSDDGGRQSTFMGRDKKTVPVASIDDLCRNEKVSYIKMDVEGAEARALAGGKHTVAAYKPKMLIAAYHYDKDIFTLPLMLWDMADDYKIYLRKHPYVPAWEINFFVRK